MAPFLSLPGKTALFHRSAWTLIAVAACSSLVPGLISQAQAEEVTVAEIASTELTKSDASVQTLEAASQDSALAIPIAASSESTPTAEQGTEEIQPLLATIGAPVKAPENPYRLRKALREHAFTLGYGQKFPIDYYKDRSDSTMVQFIPSKGRFRNSTQEFIWQTPFVVFTQPHTNFLAGIELLFRQHLTSNRHFSPFVQIGAGLNLTNLDLPEIGGRFQFSAQASVGLRAAVSKHSDILVSYGIYHLSNGGITSPNTGLNNYLATIGYSHLF